jgi:hypothetical protein
MQSAVWREGSQPGAVGQPYRERGHGRSVMAATDTWPEVHACQRVVLPGE